MAAHARRRSPLLVLLFAALVAFVAALSLGLLRGQPQGVATPSASPSPSATSTATPAATASPVVVATTPPTAVGSGACPNTYQTGDTPIVAPRKAGQHLEVALDAVRPGQNGHNRWMIRFFVPAAAAGSAFIPLDASVVGASGPLQVFGYDAGPPNAGSAPATQPITLQPCGTVPASFATGVVVVGVETSAVTSGTYTLTWRELRRPEGPRTAETWNVALTCSVVAGAPGAPPTTECR